MKGTENMKPLKYCPVCGAKKVINALKLNTPAVKAYCNKAALTPPMGWSSWNLFRDKISENTIKEIADAMDKSGLKEAGYTYVNIDDCWQSSSRSADGKLQADFINFPSGIKALNEYVNSKGLKLGIYSSNGTLTCEDYPASLGHEAIDADTFAEWGVEYFKYDFCHNVKISTKAPLIVKISVGKKYGSDVCTCYASEATLSGNARLIPELKVDGGFYIKGLDSHNGELIFENVEVPEKGEYVLTITIKKSSRDEKFLIVETNGKNKYELNIPGTKSFTPEGRIQADISLEEGKNTIRMYNPIASKQDSSFYQYKKMGLELKRATREYAEKNGTTEKPIVYSICEWGQTRPWKWGREAGNLWRTTPDIIANWASVRSIYEVTVRLSKYAGRGGWNDPDMLEVGNGNLNYEENKSHFSLWCMMCAPLILGNDIRKFILPDGTVDKENKVYKILTNKHLISIDQDTLGIPCKKAKGFTKLTGVDVLVKPLENSKVAVCVFNKDSKPAKVDIDIDKIAGLTYVNLVTKNSYKIFNCWTESESEGKAISAAPQAHGVEVYIID